jgi:ubiquinol-cytochrome c reductase cytochrome b subunit
MTAVIVVLTTMAIVEDRADDSHQAALTEARRDSHRAHELASGPNLIPPEGAMEMMRNDPFTQGPRLFAKNCSACHRYRGHNGRGVVVLDRKEILTDEGKSFAPKKYVSHVAEPTASDLAGFASADWMRGVVLNYREHFAWLRNAAWYKEGQSSGEEILDPDDSEMADWTSGQAEALALPENASDLEALIEFLVAETGHAGTTVDPQKVARGRAIAVDGDWAIGVSCADCHATIGQKFKPIDTDDTNGYPTLAEYGSAAWLKDFIRNPGTPRHYGDSNQMPAYSLEKLTEVDLDLLVRWMTGDYPATSVADYPNQLEWLLKELSSVSADVEASSNK